MSTKVVINLSTGMEDPERVMLAFLVAGGALNQGREVTTLLTKEAVRVALPGTAVGEACEGCPPLERLFAQYEEGGGKFLVCPFCFNSRNLDEAELVAHAELGGATPLWEFIGADEGATVFSY